ncbi:DUF1501 domain-containing protein [Opitutales bacterium]|nr:DUF1501 domain-containing protein [Opitutales bacterium]
MNSSLFSDEMNRRRFVSLAAKSFLGVSILPWASHSSLNGAGLGLNRPLNHAPKAKNVIYLYMSGGMTHLDTFDPKSGTETGGPTQTIKTNADGIQLADNLPLLANHAEKIAVLRGMTSTKGAHQQGNYFMHTSYAQRATIVHPSMGAWMTRLDGRFNPTLPGAVVVGGGSRHPLSGFLSTSHQPLAVGNPSEGLKNVKRLWGMTEEKFEQGLDLSQRLDRSFTKKYNLEKVNAYRDMYDDAVRLMESNDLKAFDLKDESESTRESYGSDNFGQGVLLARRLVERQVRFVEVQLGGWDTHQNNFSRVPERCSILDQALSALLDDLSKRGLLEETLVVLATEFGRTPNINVNEGRDHYPKAFSCMLAGGGIKGGQVWGKTDKEGREVIDQKVEIPDLNATIAYTLGLPLDEIIYSPTRRPFTLSDKGQPITQLI